VKCEAVRGARSLRNPLPAIAIVLVACGGPASPSAPSPLPAPALVPPPATTGGPSTSPPLTSDTTPAAPSPAAAAPVASAPPTATAKSSLPRVALPVPLTDEEKKTFKAQCKPFLDTFQKAVTASKARGRLGMVVDALDVTLASPPR